jgi:hypothetical protein
MPRINEALTFLFELVMLVLVPFALVHLVSGLAWQIALPIVVDAVIIAVWYRWLAPRGPKRLTIVPGLILATALLTLGPATLFLVADFSWAAGLTVLLGINRILAVVWKQW